MKLVLLAISLIAFSLFGAVPPPPPKPAPAPAQQQPQQTRYRHVVDDENKVMATWDRKEDSVEFKVSKDAVVAQMMKHIERIEGLCNAKILELQNQIQSKAEPAKGKK